MLLHQLRRLEFAGRAVRIEAHALQRKTQQLADVGLIINDQHAAFIHYALTTPWHSTVNCAPAGVSMNSSFASFASQTSRAMYRPRPVPVLTVVKNCSNNWLRNSIGTPGPSSTTSNFTMLPPP